VETLFRFMVTRPAEEVDVGATTVALRLRPEYRKTLDGARAAEAPIVAMRAAATKYRAANDEWSPAELSFHDPLVAFIEAISRAPQLDGADLGDAFGAAFGDTDPGQLVQDQAFTDGFGRLSDLVVTSALLGEDGAVRATDAARAIRGMAVIERLAAGDASLAADGALAAALSSTLLLPPSLFPLHGKTGQPRPPQPPPHDDAAALGKLLARRDQLQTAFTALTRIGPEHVASPAGEPAEPAAAAPAAPAAARAVAIEAVRAAEGSSAAPPARPLSVLLTADAIKAFDPGERQALEALEIDPTKHGLTSSVEKLSFELGRTEVELAKLALPSQLMQKVGDKYYPAGGLAGPFGGGAAPPQHLPTTHGSLTPAGIADLLVVRQALKRYEAYEESHIENILKGEYKELVHTRTDVKETTITVEDEVNKEEDRDLQTTERYQLQTETSNTIKNDASLKAGVAVSGSYGPMVEFKATTDFATSTSKEQASKVATDYSKEVTQKATSKLIEKHLQQVVTHYVTTVEEKNTHGFDNKTGDGPVIGQYQWVDKIYEAQVFNYGKRMLYDIQLPEPAAFLLYAAAKPSKAQADLVKPDPFTLKPSDLTEWNYSFYVEKYAVAGVDPPPAAYVTSSKGIEGKGDKDDDYIATKTEDVPIPDGYRAISASVLTWIVSGDIDNARALQTFGGHFNSVTKNAGGGWYPTLSRETATVAFTVLLLKVKSFTTSIEVLCQRASETLDAWKLKTHTAILQAYQQQLRDYQDQLAALQEQAAQEIEGRNPTANERMIRNELKKGAITLFTNQQYDWIGAIQTSAQGYPEPDLSFANLQGGYVRFFEQAFEWEQMMYFFYPYYWGRKSNWLDRVGLQDVDPLFEDFIKAGSARCVVPVRPGFEAAIAYFMHTGQIWNGGDVPVISDPLYVPIIEEIKERDQAPGDEIPQGDPWDVRLPTTLVILRKEDTLPSWHKQADGTWAPD
jgi:hypothetical protein